MLRQLRRSVIKTVAAGTVVVGTVEVATHLPTEGRSSLFYHSLCDDVVTPWMRRLLDPETAHSLAIEFAKRNWAPTHHGPKRDAVDLSCKPFDASLRFSNCVGLAAGFDKDGVVIKPMLDMGFGFVEIGSVTPEPQEGNPKPRMFRLTQEGGIINRYGFNSAGAHDVKLNLENYYHIVDDDEEKDDEAFYELELEEDSDDKEKHIALKILSASLVVLKSFYKTIVYLLPKNSTGVDPYRGVIGVNLGKNKTSQDEIADYETGIRELGPLADYLVINISSPNTPGLRDLQKADSLSRLLKAAVKARNELPLREGDDETKSFHPPLLVKLEPDMNEDRLKEAVQTIMDCPGIDGIVVTNTTTSRPDSIVSIHKTETGGLSGEPIKDMSTECVRKVYELTEGSMPIIGVGGISSGHDAYEKIKAGASLVQIYSAMVYQGPGVVSRIRRELAQIMMENGQRRVEDVVGLDHDDIYWKKRQARLMEGQNRLKEESALPPPPSLSESIVVTPENVTEMIWDGDDKPFYEMETLEPALQEEPQLTNTSDSDETTEQSTSSQSEQSVDTAATPDSENVSGGEGEGE